MDVTRLNKLKTDFHIEDEILNQVVSKIRSGRTILFLGAGFSLGAENKNGKEPLLAASLARKICELGEFEESDDLAFAADYYLSKQRSPSKLIDLLRERYSISKLSDFHIDVARENWKKVYTTNYDHCYELAALQNKKVITPVTLPEPPNRYSKRRDICIHVNGSIEQLDEETLESSFYLTESTYTESDAFSESSWSYIFKKDLETAVQILFLGYSLADLEVRRHLLAVERIREKSFFVIEEEPSVKTLHRLGKYGTVFPIGVGGFAKLLNEATELPDFEGDFMLSSLEKVVLGELKEFDDSDTRDFLLRGVSATNFQAVSLISDRDALSIKRTNIKDVIEILKTEKLLFLYGGFANGKTSFIEQVAAELCIENKDVYVVVDRDGEYENDIDQLNSTRRPYYLIIDECEQRLDIVRYFLANADECNRLILSDRTHRYRRALDEITSWGYESGGVIKLSIDYLDDQESSDLVSLMSNAGLSGDLGLLGKEAQIKMIQNDCEGQLALVLIKILESPKIKREFAHLFESILSYPNTKEAVYYICLVSHVLQAQFTNAIVWDLAGSNHLYTDEFEKRVVESGIFDITRGEVRSKSAVFSQFIIKNLFNTSYSIDKLIEALVHIHPKRNNNDDFNELYKSLMSFGTLRDLLMDRDGNTFFRFYSKLKAQLPSIRGNPHFWLQYAMSVIEQGKLSDGEKLLGHARTAGEKIKKKFGDYDFKYINNQEDRLKLRKFLASEDPNKDFDLFISAHKRLMSSQEDDYKYRPLDLYEKIFHTSFKSLTKNRGVQFEHAVKLCIQKFSAYLSSNYKYTSVPHYLQARLSALEECLEELILATRK